MPLQNIEFDRDELYAEVWRTPVSRMAAKLGVTSYVILKAAKKLGVPLPPNGHWTQVAHLKASGPTPLPAGDFPQKYRDTWKTPHAEEALLQRINEALEEAPVQEVELPEMAADLAKCLPIVRSTATQLKKAYPDKRRWRRSDLAPEKRIPC